MSTAFPYEWAETEAALDRWFKKQQELMVPMQIATIDLDTGNRPVWLVPVLPTAEAGRHPWWPIPKRITTMDGMLAQLKEVDLIYDPTRKAKPGFARGLKVRIN